MGIVKYVIYNKTSMVAPIDTLRVFKLSIISMYFITRKINIIVFADLSPLIFLIVLQLNIKYKSEYLI